MFSRSPVLPIVALVLLTGILYTSVRVANQGPVIEAVSPSVAYPGDEVVISGWHFGKVRGAGHVSIAGVVPTSSGYKSWTDQKIVLTVPEKVGSGLVYVVTDKGQSEGVLFTNKQDIPEVVSQSGQPGHPFVQSIAPASGPPGSLITITGRNFGMNRGGSTVTFQWVSVGTPSPNPQQQGTVIAASRADFDYVSWSDQEIKVRVPDGAVTGNVVVNTEKGASNSTYFEVSQVVGTKTFRDRRSYAVHYGVEVSGVQLNAQAHPGNSLYLWLPRVQSTPDQRNIQVLARTVQPMFDDVNGLTLFRLDNLRPDKSYSVAASYIFDRYAVETTIVPSRVVTPYDKTTELYKVYTAPSPGVPSDNASIKATAASVVGYERNPYLQARSVYDYILGRLTFAAEPSDPLKALESKSGNDMAYATLMTAMLRSLGIPARIVAGHVINDAENAIPHHWIEFYLQSFGWVPVDPSTADNEFAGSLKLPDNPVEYYFGNLDNRHITFSRGVLTARRMDPNGKPVLRDVPYAVQSLSEESSGNLRAYTSVWDKLMVIGVY